MKRLITNDLQLALCLPAACSVALDAELKVALNPTNSSDANKDLNDDGYANLEKYLNSLAGESSLGRN